VDYILIKEAVDHTKKTIRKKNRGRVRHVSGQELLEGIREFALSQYGPMAMMLLTEWGVKDCSDFGNMVFNMVEIGWLAKTEKDSHADFQGGYEFFEAFRKPFVPSSKLVEKEITPVTEQTSKAGL
jgi:uncharacterized repeat protein (TIGR04138 family)